MISPTLALVAWIPFTLALFAMLPARRAVLCAIFVGTLFLPEASSLRVPGLEFNKGAAISLGTILGVALFDGSRLLAFRPAWYDAFVVILSLSPFVTSLNNDLGAKDGIIECAATITTWGIPYLLGRIYLTDLAALREAAFAFVLAGIAYAPLCLIEIRLSPQLHMWVYGVFQHSFAQTLRFGGYRPTLFMRHGLEVGLFMACASLAAFSLWRHSKVAKLYGVPMSWIVAGLVIVTVGCKSSGAIALLGLGVGLLVLAEYWRSSIPLLLTIAIAPAYIATRVAGLFDGGVLVSVSGDLLNDERAGSLQYRLDNEDAVLFKSRDRPFFGWGGFDRFRPTIQKTGSLAVVDGLWISTWGRRGAVGAVAIFATFLVGPILLRRRIAPALWTHPAVAPAFSGTVIVVVHMLDCIPNAMPNPMIYLVGGGIAGLIALPQAAAYVPQPGARAFEPRHAPRLTPVAGR